MNFSKFICTGLFVQYLLTNIYNKEKAKLGKLNYIVSAHFIHSDASGNTVKSLKPSAFCLNLIKLSQKKTDWHSKKSEVR